MFEFGILIGLLVAAYGIYRWYQYEVVIETEGTVRLQSEHQHFHLHVDLPPNITIEPGDTVHILNVPELDTGRTDGEVTYESAVRVYKASWLQRHLIKNSSLIEVNELVDHP